MLDYRIVLQNRIKEIIYSEKTRDASKLLNALSLKFPEYKRTKQAVLIREIHTCIGKITSSMSNGVEKTTDTPRKTPRKRKSRPASPDLEQSDLQVKQRNLINRERLIKRCPTVRYSDLGGIDDLLLQVKESCEYPLKQRKLYCHLGVIPPTGVLLVGPSGCGKTTLANAIGGEMQVPFFSVSAPELVSSMSGESEEKIRKLFELAKKFSPSIIFIDEIDCISSKRDNSNKAMERRIVAQLLSSLDELTRSDRNSGVLVIAATNKPNSLDASLRQTNRFDKELLLSIPNMHSRAKILETLTKKMKLRGNFCFSTLAKYTPGFVGSDLAAVCKEAAMLAIHRAFVKSNGEELNDSDLIEIYIEMDDFQEAVKKVQPSAKREGFAVVPKVTWDDVGALEHVRKELELSITQPIMEPEKFENFRLTIGGGVLLYGPPGCGKTLVAKAVANQSQANFISVKGPELMNKFVGESEKGVRSVFARARASSPCVIFFDEIDSLCPRRGSGGGSSGVSERVVNQLLTEMDGVEERKAVFIIAATNRPDIIDPALLRPGRLSKKLYIPLPTVEGRYDILTKALRNIPVAEEVKSDQYLKILVSEEEMSTFSGADLASFVREASLFAIQSNSVVIEKSHFKKALEVIKPSITKEDILLTYSK